MLSDAKKVKLNNVFKRLREEGLFALQNHLCCRSCAGADIGTRASARAAKGRVIRGGVFYCRQDKEHMEESGEVYLNYGEISNSEEDFKCELSTKEVGDLTARLLREEGLDYEWSGDVAERILVNLRE